MQTMQGLRLIDLYTKRGIDTKRIYIKVESTPGALPCKGCDCLVTSPSWSVLCPCRHEPWGFGGGMQIALIVIGHAAIVVLNGSS